MFEEFRKFILRGNVMDLAVGVIMGGVFNAVVKSLVNDLLMPPIGLLLIVVCGIAKTSLSSVFRTMAPYVGILIVSLLVIMFIPWIILVVPRMIWPTL